MTDMRAEYGRPEYEILWRQARKAVQRGQVKLGFKAPSAVVAVAVSELIDAPVEAGVGQTIAVADLDARLRAGKFHCGLSEVLEEVHGAPVAAGETPSSRTEWVDEILWSALSAAGLDGRSWAHAWVEQVRRYGKIMPERLASPAALACAILADLVLEPVVPTTWVPRTVMAARHGAGPCGLDRGRKVTSLVLLGAALAHRVELPRSARDERTLWERCGVAVDRMSASVLWWSQG
ncbi:MAG: TIGR02679 domain-containing protein, partial [Actinomycetota bacterium]|nr:TIGR02679 domain-containing protein [Actinomycetota bacterium]